MVQSPVRRRARFLAVSVIALLLGAATLAGCEWPEGTRYVDLVYTNLTSATGVTYRQTTDVNGAAVTLKLDIYAPAGDTAAKRPVVMWMFGGYWAFGDRSQMTSAAQDSARRGYVGVTIDYRKRSDAVSNPVPAALDAYDDAVAAVQWLKDHAAEYKIDPTAIFAGGFSAGAINAQHLLFLPGTRGPATSPIAGAISYSGFSFSAATAGDPPLIDFNGADDTLVSPITAEGQCTYSRDLGNVCDFNLLEGQGHAFTVTTEMRETSHHFLMDNVLVAKGYSGAV